METQLNTAGQDNTTSPVETNESAKLATEPAQPSESKAESKQVQANENIESNTSNAKDINYDDLKIDGGLLSSEYLNEFKAFAKAKGLSSELAKELIARESGAVQFREKQIQDQLEQDSLAWAEASKKDPEIGGEKFDASVQLAKRGLDKLATPKLVQFLEASKLGNHPEVIRLFARAGELFANDKHVNARTNNVRAKNFEDLFYGTNNN